MVEKDSNHGRAIPLVSDIVSGKYGPAVTSDYVFDETVTVVLVRSKSLKTAIIAGDVIKESISMLYVDERLFEYSWEKFRNQVGTKFSFTDCSIIALLEDNHINKLATFDKEFITTELYEVVK